MTLLSFIAKNIFHVLPSEIPFWIQLFFASDFHMCIFKHCDYKFFGRICLPYILFSMINNLTFTSSNIVIYIKNYKLILKVQINACDVCI